MAADLSRKGQEMIKGSAKLLFVLVLSVYGCTTVPEPKYYRIPTDASAASNTSFQSYQESLRVARFHAIPPLRQDRIVTYREGAALVDFSPFECWESPPPEIVNRKLAEAFRASQLFSRVDNRPSRPPADYILRGRILQFNQLHAEDGLYGEVGLEVEFVHRETSAILWSAVIRARERAECDNAEAASHAVGDALAQCIGQILQQVKQVTAYHGSPA